MKKYFVLFAKNIFLQIISLFILLWVVFWAWTIISSLSQTVSEWDIITSTWYNLVNNMLSWPNTDWWICSYSNWKIMCNNLSASDSGSSGGGNIVLAKWNFSWTTESFIEDTFTLSQTGVLHFHWSNKTHYTWPLSNAWSRVDLNINWIECSSDTSFEWESTEMYFFNSAMCIKELWPWTHTLKVSSEYMPWINLWYNSRSSIKWDYVVYWD